MYDHDEMIIQVRVTIQGIEPPIWRRLHLPFDLNLAQLHEVIQASFGWTDSHLHQFIIGGLVYGAPEFDELQERTIFEATQVFIRDFDLYHEPQPRLLYEYDFGDSWRHLIVFDEVMPRQAGTKYPLCIDGARHRPPEDVGGTGGYSEFLKAWSDPDHEQHSEMRQWVGLAFAPEKFDIGKTNKAISAALRKCKGGYRFRLDNNLR